MDIQVRCGFCDASNISSAFSCSACHMPLIDEVGTLDAPAPAAPAESASPGAPAAAPPPPPATRRPLGPYTGPPREMSEVAAPVAPAEDGEAATTTTVPKPGYRIGGNVIAGADAAAAEAPLHTPRDPNRIVWGWHHVVALAVLAWGIPFAAERLLGVDRSIEAFLNRSLAVQIISYLVSGFAVGALVWTRQKGDWSTLGLGNDVRQGRIDLLRGFGFGLAMFLGYLPVGLFTNGRTSLDPMIGLLLGNADGTGLVLTCAVVVIGAPVVEEIFFRGLLYEKIARRFPEIAVVVTAGLFMAVHRALILQIFLLGVVFAIKRSRGESVWYTIGAHAAWNASVTVVGVVILTTSAVHFTSSTGTFELEYAKDWQRDESVEMSLPAGKVELALTSPNGSIMGVVTVPDVPSMGRLGSSKLLNQLPPSMSGPGGSIGNLNVEPAPLPGASEAYDITASLSMQGMSLDYHMVAARPDGSDDIAVFMLACPSMSCDASEPDFEKLVESIEFN